jgi:hypothetical protein
MEITINPALSALVAGAMKGADLTAPEETIFHLKDGKGFSSYMGISSIVDFATKKMTILDPATMRYATFTSDQLVDETARAMPQIPASARAALGAVKTSVSAARLTGRTATIQGVEAEEREIVVSIEGLDAPNTPPGPSMRMVMQLWAAKSSEALRVPAIRELTGYALYSYATMNPTAMLERMVKELPGFSGGFESMIKEMQQGTTMLRMHIDMFMPGLAAMLQQLRPGGNAAGAVADDGAPLMQVNQELVELSTTSVPDSVFQIPEGYKEAPAAELMETFLAKGRAAAQQ